jgi:hypothetical protein
MVFLDRETQQKEKIMFNQKETLFLANSVYNDAITSCGILVAKMEMKLNRRLYDEEISFAVSEFGSAIEINCKRAYGYY